MLGLLYLSSVFVCICICMCILSHLFENHDLIQEVNTLASEEFPNGLLSLESLRVRVGAHLGGLIPEEVCQRVVLWADGEKDKSLQLGKM